MGSFEKLGILVIVIIIVMILAVAIHQWGGGASGAGPNVRMTIPGAGQPGPTEREIGEDPPPGGGGVERGAKTWANGVPRRYTIRKNDKIWNLVTGVWNLPESFVGRIKQANPGVDFRRLRVGDELIIPDPGGSAASADSRGKAASDAKLVHYEIQEGDHLENIALRFLGAKHRWRKIQEVNPGIDPKRLRPGRWIWIPIG